MRSWPTSVLYGDGEGSRDTALSTQHSALLPLLVSDEAVADAGLGDEDARAGGVFLQFAAQLVDVDAQILRLVAVFRAPDALEEHPLRQHLARLARQFEEQLPLGRRQMHLRAVARDGPPREIDRDGPRADDRIGRRGHLRSVAECDADAGE